ncbi:HNH endonuclease [Saccharococcus caldoxylosilyticus]|uniref:HNH endonuclease n=1 Tax=Saccharococcus caldoxylosilyticus TaxID=81408 RepID=UPI001FCC71CA|nr:HNH endonuclease [Parageobacillus caldoxylosilyticus]BDG36477.1 hypothetical protein PcaKH15_23830 [Parageobacillus caldoxylosilyticus]BDG40265.1 hypothetical protein PcaKH16_24040 [Parageobacillus caldoxylosilyticus]BDG44013.1 hypothetical protein PcaKH35_23580 [Parageobacillus caldoxylosilyticus]
MSKFRQDIVIKNFLFPNIECKKNEDTGMIEPVIKRIKRDINTIVKRYSKYSKEDLEKLGLPVVNKNGETFYIISEKLIKILSTESLTNGYIIKSVRYDKFLFTSIEHKIKCEKLVPIDEQEKRINAILDFLAKYTDEQLQSLGIQRIQNFYKITSDIFVIGNKLIREKKYKEQLHLEQQKVKPTPIVQYTNNHVFEKLESSKIVDEDSIATKKIDNSQVENEIKLTSTPKMNEIVEKDTLVNHFGASEGTTIPQRIKREVKIIKRKQDIVTDLKELYDNTCQICGLKLEIGHRKYYSEVHHIQPLGLHKGPDITENMVVVCPNHHKMFDKGAITIDLSKKITIHANGYWLETPLILKHYINPKYVDYHNTHIFLNKVSNLLDSKPNDTKNIKQKQIVSYGNSVTIVDIETGEEFNIEIEDKYHKAFMTDIQKILLGKKIDSIIVFNGYQYKITGIMEQI